MKALIICCHTSAKCVWCEKDKECVTVEFGDGFLAKNNLCWRCLAKAVKVRSQQETSNKESAEVTDHQSTKTDKRRDAS